MKTEQINFSRNSYYKGRNGYANCLGIELTDWEKNTTDIELTVINSKSSSSAVKISIPKSDIQQLIDKLKMFL